MKKFLLIICIFCFVSIPNFSFADGTLENLLDLKYGPEAFEMEMVSLPEYTFSDTSVQKTYDTYASTMEALKSAIIEKYANDEFDYYQMKGITTNFSYFVYYTDQMFKHIKQKELGYGSKELNITIHRDYEKSRTFYNALKNSVYKK